MTDESLLHQVIYQIANTPMRKYPYPHLITDNVFPSDYYKEMLRLFPEQKLMDSHSATYKKRTIFKLSDIDDSSMSDEQKTFWTGFNAALGGDEFRNFMLDVWGTSFRETYSFHTYSRIELAEDMPGYSIGAHKDSHNKMVTILFYLAEDTKRRDLGTNILVPKGEIAEGFGHGNNKEFHQASMVEFVPNRMFAFAPNDYTYHSVSKLQTKLPRKTVQFNITHKDLGKI